MNKSALILFLTTSVFFSCQNEITKIEQVDSVTNIEEDLNEIKEIDTISNIVESPKVIEQTYSDIKSDSDFNNYVLCTVKNNSEKKIVAIKIKSSNDFCFFESMEKITIKSNSTKTFRIYLATNCQNDLKHGVMEVVYSNGDIYKTLRLPKLVYPKEQSTY